MLIVLEQPSYHTGLILNHHGRCVGNVAAFADIKYSLQTESKAETSSACSSILTSWQEGHRRRPGQRFALADEDAPSL